MTTAEWIQCILLFILVSGLGGVIYAAGLFSGSKDQLGQIQSSMGIIFGSTFAIILLLGIFSYMYIQSDTTGKIFPIFTLFMLFVNMELSLIAVSAAVLQKTV
jgi:hypothetical protein